MKILSRRFLVLALPALLLAGCAVKHLPAQLQDLSGAQPPVRRLLAEAVEVHLATGYTRTLKPGSQWQAVGSLPEGTVYRPVNDVFTLEGAHIHEAYLVVQGTQLAGFYLPAERGFSRLHPSPTINFK